MFVAWQLWGTGIYTQQQQQRLDEHFSELPRFVAHADTPPGPPSSFDPKPGDPVFKLKIPAIDLNGDRGYLVVEGVGDEQLAMGPGHYPSCGVAFHLPLCTDFTEVWPGQEGRVIVSGHRTTHLAPFLHTDQLENGDELIVVTRWGTFTYVVYDQRSVDDADTSIVRRVPGVHELVLTTCDPPGSASRRLITFARLSAS